MGTISTDSYNLVIDGDTQQTILSDDGKWVLLNRASDDSLHYYDLKYVEEVFGQVKTNYEPAVSASSSSAALIHNEVEDINNLYDMPSTSKNSDERYRITWSHQNILKLINIYGDHASLFKSQAIRHEKVWKMIADKMPGFTVNRIKNKFKYLKARYIKKVENMSERASGHDKYSFDFFEEFENLFGKDPNVRPLSLASSLNKRKREEETINFSTEEKRPYLVELQETTNSDGTVKSKPDHFETQKKDNKLVNKIDKLTEVLVNLRQDLNNREEARERRHQENMKRKQEATDAFKEYLNFLRNKQD